MNRRLPHKTSDAQVFNAVGWFSDTVHRFRHLKSAWPVATSVIFTLVLFGLLPNALSADEGPKKRIVCSTTQIADFARNIVGDRCVVDCVLGAGVDPHLYQTKPGDVAMVEAADLCLANGWHLEGGDWMQRLANDAQKKLVICVDKGTPLMIDEGGEPIHDPHAWFTPTNAGQYVRNILRGISQVDPSHADEYKARSELFLRQLGTLDAWIQKQVNQIPPAKRILVTSHDAFGYFCQRYGFKSAAPAGWSTGQEVGGGLTPERRQRSIDSIRKFGVRSIFVETSVSKELITEIAKEAGVEIGGELYSDSMGKPGSAGQFYLGMMRENVIKIVSGLK